MNEIQTLPYHPTVEVRMVIQNDEPWWVLADVCRVLELTTPAKVAERLDDDEKGMSFIHTPGGTQEMTIINESGLYSVILRSNKLEAKAFKQWITHEVLPSIRRTGAYSVKGVDHSTPPSSTLPPCIEALPLSTAAQLLLRMLQDFNCAMPTAGGEVQISNRRLARLLGLGSIHTLTTARRELVNKGYIEFSPGIRNNPSIYQLKKRGGLAQMQNI